MPCAVCGRAIPDKARRCVHCGAMQPANDGDAPVPVNRIGRAIGILLAAALILLVVLGLMNAPR
ncbi:hypothetical protein SOM26_15150 [Sphingomonas sp. CFBP8993]|nr:hypothetical protein [Sphingomonas sp. CFBP8993]